MARALDTALSDLPGIGPARAAALAKLGLHRAADLLRYFPRDYEDRRIAPSALANGPDALVCFHAVVTEGFRVQQLPRGLSLCKGMISDGQIAIEVTFFRQSYLAERLRAGAQFLFCGKLSAKGRHYQMSNPLFEPEEAQRQLGGITALYPLTAGIGQALLQDLLRRVLPLAAQMDELLPPPLLRRYQLAQMEFSYQNIHAPASFEALALARARFIFEELYCLSLGLQFLRRRQGSAAGPPFPKRDLSAFRARLPFALTGAQGRAIEEISGDLAAPQPMNRLLQGDVGSGKTAVAAAAAFLAVQNGYQCALMAPTELLARQHEKSMQTLLRGSDIRTALLLGSMTAAEKRRVKEEAARGACDLLIGTHALLTKDVAFSRLGLVITDEQHRFGVGQRAALASKAQGDETPHVLVMSATPIPRTLALMVYGELSLSLLDELPPGRRPVATYVIGEEKRARMYGFLRAQVREGRQVYIVCPTVEEGGVLELKAAEQYGEDLKTRVFPDLSLGILHGRMKPKEKEAVMEDFLAGRISILVATTVIEVGVDVPNASVMVVENAERFGLSQLHQLRGRVGRGAAQSHCILLRASGGETAKKRLRTLAETNDGFAIAEADLLLRGPGDFFGSRQHGLPALRIADLAGDMRVLQDAQAAAEETLHEDPLLQAPKHAALRRQMEALFARTGESLN